MEGGMVTTHHNFNLVGLARVSTVIQDAQLQRDALMAAGCGRTRSPSICSPNAPALVQFRDGRLALSCMTIVTRDGAANFEQSAFVQVGPTAHRSVGPVRRDSR